MGNWPLEWALLSATDNCLLQSSRRGHSHLSRPRPPSQASGRVGLSCTGPSGCPWGRRSAWLRGRDDRLWYSVACASTRQRLLPRSLINTRYEFTDNACSTYGRLINLSKSPDVTTNRYNSPRQISPYRGKHYPAVIVTGDDRTRLVPIGRARRVRVECATSLHDRSYGSK